jgi:arabinogalactan endo-1,4-beta-galactosidase
MAIFECLTANKINENKNMTLHNRLILSLTIILMCCSSSDPAVDNPPIDNNDTFYFGADLSYVNQILDHGGVYKVNGNVENPYTLFDDKGTNLVRLRLWHNPEWTKEVYGSGGTQLYNDIADVEKAITSARSVGMKVLLDFHYSDTWADPGKQYIPAAWTDITLVSDLEDSIYNYTFKTLQRLSNKDLLPEFVQLGNETNCGMLYSDAPLNFPTANVCNGQWAALGKILNAGIKAVRDVTANTTIKTKIVLHVADPKNVDWWFTNIKSNGQVTDFDVIGFSYYPLWHTTVPVNGISEKVLAIKSKFSKGVMILETGYPWTTAGNDGYNNIFGSQPPLSSYPFTPEGQSKIMKAITQELKTGGGVGIIYWEPGWISSSMKDMWGTGSSWENVTFFDFDGNATVGFDYMTSTYD